MQIQSEIDQERDLIVYTLSGMVNINDVREVFKEIIESRGLAKNLLLDTRPAIFSKPLVTEDVYELVGELEHYPEKLRLFAGCKSAVIAETDLGFGIMRMFNSISELKGLSLTLVPFRAMEEALEYVDED